MTDVPGFFAAFAAGFFSFASPCVLPLIPVYLSFISGESVSSLKGGNARRGFLLARSALFVLGFSIVFVILAIAFGGGMSFAGARTVALISRIAGVLVVILSLNMLFDFIPFLRGEFRAHSRQPNGKRQERQGTTRDGGNAVLLGMAFAAGWTPCVGPILSSILLYAGNSGNVAHAAILLALYSAGLGIPFIATGLFLDRLLPAVDFLKRHDRAVRVASAVLLALLAIPMIAGRNAYAALALALSNAITASISAIGAFFYRSF